jgi:hypothetical protein
MVYLIFAMTLYLLPPNFGKKYFTGQRRKYAGRALVIVVLRTDKGFPLGLAVRHGSVGNPPPMAEFKHRGYHRALR